MTIESEVSEAEAVASDEPTPRRHSRSIGAIVATVIAGLGLLALAGWGIWTSVASTAVEGVRVVYDAQPVVCEGAEVGTTSDPESIEFLQPIIDLTPAMTCQLRIQVVNDGWSDVTVTTVGLRNMNVGNPLGIEAMFVNPNGQEMLDNPENVDALFDLAGDGIVVAPDEIVTFTAFFGYEGDAQMEQCSSTGWNPPFVTVTAPGATRDVSPSDEFFIWVGMGTEQDCA